MTPLLLRLLPLPVAATLLIACDAVPTRVLTGPPASAEHALGPALTEWSAPVDVGPAVNASNSEISPALSPDGRSLYFASARDAATGFDIWVARRDDACTAFGEPVKLGPQINTAEREQGAFVSPDGHLLFFTRGDALMTSVDIWVARRTDVHDDLAWEAPMRLGDDVNAPGVETEPWLVLASGEDDGVAHLYFGRGPANQQQDFYVARVTRDGETLGPAVPVAELNSSGTPPLGNEDGIAVRGDGREAIFASRRLAAGAAELFVSTRGSVDAPWGAPRLISELNSALPELHPALSDDRRSLVFSSGRSGPRQFRIYLATRGIGRGNGPGCG